MQILTRQEQRKANYQYYKDRKVCVRCRKSKVWGGTTLCLQCLMDNRERVSDYNKNRRPEQSRLRQKEHAKRRIDCLRENGLCIRCGIRKASDGHATCAICRAKKRIYAEKVRREKGSIPRDMMGKGEICYLCGAKVDHYEKTCDKCHDKLAKQMLYARSKKTTVNYFEKLCKAHRQFYVKGGDASG